ncbi:ShlB/FhaC/HecB family hemolysin secretion/activation protein [Photobacterium toruni]|uniref:ShlB/FhaC/HecB family hemolysin secretion/activation protein n=1 Tax=Photobacterium toruni TaxID=1935446 RepID=UPI0021102975|nr:ShlB/FhaC/HecB family hemolysin secretion/activation protein [Photobacterium toruni]
MIKRIVPLLLFYNSIAFANLPPNSKYFSPISESRRALQDSNREIKQLSKLSHQEQIEQNLNKSELKAKKQILPESDICLPISGIYLQGITLLNNTDLENITPISHDCITTATLNLLAREVTQLYLDKGFITARVQFIQPNKDGELGVQVIEGFIEKIVGGNWWINTRFLFPNTINKPLNLRVLDQGLDQANRLQSNQATLDILPGQLSGGSIVVLHNRHKRPWFVSTSIDNYGQINTGEWLGHTTLSFDSPFGMSDFFSININTTIKSYSEKFNRSYTLFYSVPYGNLTFSNFYSYSQYLTKLQLPNSLIDLDGNTQQYGIKGDYLAYRDQDNLITLSGQLTQKRVNNYFADALILVSSPKLSVLELSVNHAHIFTDGVLNSNFSIEKGLSILGIDSSKNIINNQFVKYKFALDFNQYFTAFDANYQFKHQLFAQYSPDPLPGLEWLSLTERSAIRGFSHSSVSGDNGWYIRNTLSRSYWVAGSQVTPRVGFDLGQVYPQGKRRQESTAFGFSLGITAHYNQATIDIDISRGEIVSGSVTRNEPIMALFNLAYQF